MPVPLRSFQRQLEADIYAAWQAGAVNVMPVAATGGGKTVVISKLLYDEPGASIAIAHRQELVSQISIAIAKNGVRHRIIANPTVRRIISALQVAEVGYSYIDPTAKTGVGGIDTIVKMTNEPWFDNVRLQIQDEGHHVLKDNKWGRGANLFRNARGVFPTATPRRADGRGLGRKFDGIVDSMVLAPGMREIINMGFLTDYRIFCPPIPKDFDLSNVGTSEATGDLNAVQLRKARHASATLTGDVVDHYQKYAPGKLGVTFEVDVLSAGETARAFRERGVKAEVVTANTPIDLRAQLIAKFRRREILQLVNVDLFGEGFDLPAIEVVIFARPTDSFALFSQQWGRTLRLMVDDYLSANWDNFSVAQRLAHIKASSKPHGIIIDPVGNTVRHNGPPDKHQNWSLERRERRKKSDPDEIPVRVCIECLQAFERVLKRCPYCDYYQAPDSSARTVPAFVDGDLTELDEATLKALRGEITRKDGYFYAPGGLPVEAQRAARGHWMRRQEEQHSLRNAIAWWAGLQAAQGYSESESYRRFFFRFGVDVANAQLLNGQESRELASTVQLELARFNIDGTVNAEVYFS
jgi:DNA repair protein RadD